jgi:hypothetical protein
MHLFVDAQHVASPRHSPLRLSLLQCNRRPSSGSVDHCLLIHDRRSSPSSPQACFVACCLLRNASVALLVPFSMTCHGSGGELSYLPLPRSLHHQPPLGRDALPPCLLRAQRPLLALQTPRTIHVAWSTLVNHFSVGGYPTTTACPCTEHPLVRWSTEEPEERWVMLRSSCSNPKVHCETTELRTGDLERDYNLSLMRNEYPTRAWRHAVTSRNILRAYPS